MNMKAARGERPTATDAEALAYMYPLTLERPISYQWTQIYLYLATKVCSAAGKEVPGDIKVEALDDYDMHQLNDLKNFIYWKRIQARKDKERQERTEKKKQASEEKVLDQPPLL